ncbi:hypothetical protein [Streptomyces spectabilis]|uniref:Uncharacterized protein n=1 Tax=Streptomyces spectabilis TaxID=68270 RepID=A0A7W8B4F5_STRST|nr:hypothetical protein [Streptomyces spectabilis]MBB5109742.1 hypothetical protein [Streptomyces spectabilis]GGV58929.1 hypothetical protein GCM10010245_92060 [Streptomyces spectabilis]
MLITHPKTVPYITARVGEDCESAASLRAGLGPDGRRRLAYRGERRGDRNAWGVLWARCAQAPRDKHRMPMGEPRGSLMHPSRQRETMQHLLCQVCGRPARTQEGVVFLAGPTDHGPHDTSVITCQPPVCPRHAPVAVGLCPLLDGTPDVFLTASCPMHGALGTPYAADAAGELRALPPPERPVRYEAPGLEWLLATHLARRLRSFRRISLHDIQDLEPLAPCGGVWAGCWT